MAFLPDGRMLVTQKAGSMVIVSADGSAVQATVGGVPAVLNDAQGGLLDVAIDPDFATAPWVYLTYSQPGLGGSGVALGRGRLVGNTLQDWNVLWQQTPKMNRGNHYGSRIAFRPDKTLYVTLGDREENIASGSTSPQNVANGIGKVMRLNRDGSIPTNNPTFAAGAVPGLWSLGHRNAQGAAVKPGSDELWLTEHGPQGGDELNRVLPGRNYGWPVKSYGCPYGSPVGEACRIGGGTHAPDFEEPKSTWVPTSTAPSNMTFYAGDKFPEWSGNIFVGSMRGLTLWRLVINANNDVTSREEVAAVKQLAERIRDVEVGPDGWMYLLTDSGKLIRLER